MLPKNWDLPEDIRKRFGKGLGRQRAMSAEGHLVLILHDLPTSESSERQSAAYWRAPDGRWSTSRRGTGRPALTALKNHVEEYWTRVLELEARYEAATTSTDFFDVLEEVVPLTRAAKNMLAALQGAREAVPDDTEIISLRDLASDVDREAEILYSDARNGLDFTSAKRAEEQARAGQAMAKASHRLNLLIGVFLPLTALGSMFGMNMKTGLETLPSWVFWTIFSVSLFAGLLLSIAVLRGRDRS